MYAGPSHGGGFSLRHFDHPCPSVYTSASGIGSVRDIGDDPDKKLASIPGVVPEIYQDIKGRRFF